MRNLLKPISPLLCPRMMLWNHCQTSGTTLESFSLEIVTHGTPDQGSEDNRSCGVRSNTGTGYRSDRTTGHPPRTTPRTANNNNQGISFFIEQASLYFSVLNILFLR